MGDYQITCKEHDSQERIIKVGLGRMREMHSTDQVVKWIRDGTHTFYTLKNGDRAKVLARQRSDTGYWYLTTEPDNEDEKNLDFLPDRNRQSG